MTGVNYIEYENRICLEYNDCFTIKFSGSEYEACLSSCKTQVFWERELVNDILHHNEKIFYDNLKYERRINSFLLGRYAAKKAISKLSGEKNLRKIQIENGVFNQPIVRCEANRNIQVSITHCDNLGLAIAFPEIFLLGVDIEEVDPKKSRLIEMELTQNERELAYKCPLSYDCFLISMWTIKESLSKVLKTGLTVPLSVLEIKNIEFKDDSFVSIFSNFIQYCTVSFIVENYICSIAYPRNVELDIDICSIKNNLYNLLF